MATPIEQMPLPVIKAKDGFRYQMTRDDMLMLGRALNGEEGASGSARLAWCYAQRYVMNRTSYSSFASMVTQHSQVVNPRWASDGPHCSPGGDYYGKAECNGAQNRNYNRTRAWSTLKSDVQDALFAWASGNVENMIPRGVDFAAVSLVARKIAGRNAEGFRVVYQGPPGNTVVSTARSRAWPSDDFVELEVNGRTAGLDTTFWLGAIAGPIAIVGAAMGLLAAWSARR
jgi:hypothetical protein